MTTLSPLYATVAVDQPLDSPFTYAVPVSLRREIRPGSRVTVPLGRGNRPTEGTVLAVATEPPDFNKPHVSANREPTDTPEPSLFGEGEPGDVGAVDKEPGTPFKEILDLHREVLPVSADLLDLARWISTYYCAPLGMTIATMVPAAVKRATRMPSNVIVSLADPTPSIDDQLAAIKISPASKKAFTALHAVLLTGPRRELEALTEAGIGREMLKRLGALGLLKTEREIKLPEPMLVGAEGSATKIEHLSADQQSAMTALAPLVDANRFAVRLIHGVTGSGKTELYIRAIEQVVAQGKSAIVLVPEISLTPQTARRFTARFPRVAILHSGMKDSERHQHWHAIASGWAQVIVGARSAIFAPAPNLGLIVVDEEHDASYKQDNLPKYHGRDVALRRAQMLNVPVLLGSATPSLESWHNAHTHKDWELLSLRSRPLGTQMPRVLVVDMKGQAKERRGLHILSTVLEHHLKQTLEQKKQAIFLLNRRGYAHYVMCPRCDWVLMCDNCDATMVVHRKRHEENSKLETRNSKPAEERRAIQGTVQCHYCLTAMMLPERCPLCEARLTHLGQGTQRAEDELLRKFPGLRVQRMDSDSMHHAADYQAALDAFGRGEIDLLIGTQMIAKGLDFPNVQLVGVLNSDLAMTIPDFRAAERTFQLICQVAGRAGRNMGGEPANRRIGESANSARLADSPIRPVAVSSPSTVVVQTFQPQEPAIAYACSHDYLGFVKSELPHRQEFGYPPYGRLVRIVLAHKGWTQVNDAAASLGRLIAALAEKLKLPIRVQGPFPPPMERLVELYRVEFIVSAMSARPLQQLVASLRGRGILSSASRALPGGGGQVQVSVDVDPVHMM